MTAIKIGADVMQAAEGEVQSNGTNRRAGDLQQSLKASINAYTDDSERTVKRYKNRSQSNTPESDIRVPCVDHVLKLNKTNVPSARTAYSTKIPGPRPRGRCWLGCPSAFDFAVAVETPSKEIASAVDYVFYINWFGSLRGRLRYDPYQFMQMLISHRLSYS